ncbi:uncharacterized protein LOC119066843 [Bradysia coprophila]|uniref:uncharacterized protein LOC119066843 n=1 Tax=Bradysia coprophila TaxID=38358 RepID=UPI00187DACF0|nr:uncharacterized protein LOC119066843 [Bradysia coprophila]
MSLRLSDPEKPRKKFKKIKRRKGSKKTKNIESEVTVSTGYSQDVDPPSTIITSLNSAIIKWNQEEARGIDPYEHGDYSKMPHEAPNEVNFVGGIGPNTGHHRSKKFIDRTTQIQQIYNMRCDNKTIFNFCEDPRPSNIPLRKNINDAEKAEIVAKNTARRIVAIQHEQLPIEKPSDQSTLTEQVREHTSDACLEDYQFTDNKQASLEIRKQFLDQKRTLLKQKLKVEVPQRLGDEYRKEKFKLSEYYDIDKTPGEVDMESVIQVEEDWTEKYKVEAHYCDLKFGRPMPFIPTLPQTEKLVSLTRTLDKPRNLEKLREEVQNYSKPIEENVMNDFPYRETARELKKILQKQKIENLSIELALKDFDEFMESSNVLNGAHDGQQEIIHDEPRGQHLHVVMKDYEEKILKKLLEIDAPSFERPDEDPELLENNEEKKKDVSSQEITLPMDFTYPFEARQIDVAVAKGCADIEQDVSNIPSEESRLQENETEQRNDREDVKKTESFCTNFTDDSGSFIAVPGKKLHFNQLLSTKKTTKIRPQKPAKKFDEYLCPYEVLPLKEAKKLNRRDNKLVPEFDYKERLRVDVPQFDSERIGVKNRKYVSQLATEWDEYYQKEILNRPRIRRFKPRTIIKQVVDSLRLKYESTFKREYLTEKTIIIEQEKMFIQRAEEFRDFCTAFFSNLTTTNYRQSMAKIQDLRPMYELNDQLTSELTSLQNELIQLRTAIIRTEGRAREATILQNVSYLMKEPNWREKNDWIHKKPDGYLETIKESIENRMTTNLRKRDNDNVWAIKEFFEQQIFTNKRPALICFETPQAIIDTITDFKIQLYLSLLKLDLSTWTLVNLSHAYNSYIKWSTDFIENRKKYVEARCARKYFLDICTTHMKKDAVELINSKLVESISEKTLRTLEPLCNTLFIIVIPKNIRDQVAEGSSVLLKFRLIISHAMNMLEQIDSIPSTKRKEIEKNIRKENGFIERRTARAVELETHFEKARKVMIKHSNPPFRRQPRTGKLPRSYAKTSKPKPVQKDGQPEDGYQTVRLAISRQDFEVFLPPNPSYFYLDSTFFGGDADVPNMDFLPEIKTNIDEFIVDVKNVLAKWEQNKQERYLEEVHNTWTTTFGGESG